jgi:hypothetical protein
VTEIILHWQMFHANAAVNKVNVAKRTKWICFVRICLLLLALAITRITRLDACIATATH